MAYTTTWSAAYETTPANSDSINQGDDAIRTLKVAIRERMATDHEWRNTNEDGKHKLLTLVEQTTPADPASGQAKLYPVAKGTQTALVLMDDGGDTVHVGGGFEALADSDATLNMEDVGLQTMTPTADRTLTLPTTDVAEGWSATFMNLATGAFDIILNASGGSAIGNVKPGQAVMVFARQATPTTPAHWRVGPFDVPVGKVDAFATTEAPCGWLACDGSEVSRTTYDLLFNLVGTTFGVGDGSTTFNLPDLRGRTIIGLDNLGGSSADVVTATEADSLGGTEGEETHTLTIAEIPSHSHDLNDTLVATGAAQVASYNTVSGSGTTAAAGGGGAHNNMQPYMALGYFIKW